EEVDLGVAPFHRGYAGRDRHLPVDFFFVVVGGGGTIVYTAQLGRGAAGVQHGRSQGSLARVRVPDHNQIADVLAFVNFKNASFKANPRRSADDSIPKCSNWLLAFGQEGRGLQWDEISTS